MSDETRLKAFWNLLQNHAEGIEGPTTPCPDCAAAASDDEDGGKTLKHEQTCPLYGGVQRACDADRDFFASHPNTNDYYRPITRAEIVDFEHMTGNRVPEWVNRVHVVQVAPGVRFRQPIGIADHPQVRRAFFA